MTGSLGSESGLADTGIELRLAPGLDVDCDQLQALCWPMAQCSGNLKSLAGSHCTRSGPSCSGTPLKAAQSWQAKMSIWSSAICSKSSPRLDQPWACRELSKGDSSDVPSSMNVTWQGRSFLVVSTAPTSGRIARSESFASCLTVVRMVFGYT